MQGCFTEGQNSEKMVLPNIGENSFIDPSVSIDNPERLHIGTNCKIHKGVIFYCNGGEIVIGDNCEIHPYSILHGDGGIYINNDSVIGERCSIYSYCRSFDTFEVPITKQPIHAKGVYLMGDNIIGPNCVICDDVNIGKGSVIGGNSYLTDSVPMASIVMGNPAQVIRNRYEGKWDFHMVERPFHDQLPDDIENHIQTRGRLICHFIDEDDIVLDVGCGEGILSSIYAKKAKKVCACDYSAQAVAKASERYREIEFIQSHCTGLGYEDMTFTKVTMSDVAEHLMPVQFIRSLRDISRVLKPGGMFILATPITGKGTNTSNYAHIYEFSREEIEFLLGKFFTDIQFHDQKFGLFTAIKK